MGHSLYIAHDAKCASIMSASFSKQKEEMCRRVGVGKGIEPQRLLEPRAPKGVDIYKQTEHHLLFVLIWPALPQLAHLRWVPPAAVRLGAVGPALSGAGEAAADSGEPAGMIPLAFSRPRRRSLLRSSRTSSAWSLIGSCGQQ